MAKIKTSVKERKTLKEKTITREDVETLVRVKEILEEAVAKEKKQNRKRVRRNKISYITTEESLGLGTQLTHFKTSQDNSMAPCCPPPGHDVQNFATGAGKGEDGTGLNTGGKGGK